MAAPPPVEPARAISGEAAFRAVHRIGQVHLPGGRPSESLCVPARTDKSNRAYCIGREDELPNLSMKMVGRGAGFQQRGERCVEDRDVFLCRPLVNHGLGCTAPLGLHCHHPTRDVPRLMPGKSRWPHRCRQWSPPSGSDRPQTPEPDLSPVLK